MKKLLLNSIVIFAVLLTTDLIHASEISPDQRMIIKTEWEKDIAFEEGKSVSVENAWVNGEKEFEFVGVSYADRKESGRQLYTGNFSSDGQFSSKLLGKAPDFWYLMNAPDIIRNISAVYKGQRNRTYLYGNFREPKKRNQPQKPLHKIENVRIYETPDFNNAFSGDLTRSIVMGTHIYYCGSAGLFKTTYANRVLWLSQIKECKEKEIYAVTDMAIIEGKGIYTVGLFGESESKFGLKSPAEIVVSKFDFNGRFIGEKSFQTGIGTFNMPKIAASKSGVFVANLNLDVPKIPSLEKEKQQTQGCTIATANKNKLYCQITSLDADLNLRWNKKAADIEGPPAFSIASSDDYIFISSLKMPLSQMYTEFKVYNFSGEEVAHTQLDASILSAKLFAVENDACVMVGQVYNIDKTVTVGAVKVKVSEYDPSNKPRIGVYDSRSLAIAFAGSKKHEAIVADLTRKIEQAKADGDDKRAERLKKRIEREQMTLHRQAFGTEPVHYYLQGYYPKQLRGLKEKLGLERILSKWNKESLEYYKDFQQIDVTEQVIEIPGPNDKQRRSALEIRKHKPLTKEQLEKNKSSL